MATRAKRQAPAGCFWKGDSLYGRVRLQGQRTQTWHLDTSDPKIARQRFEKLKTDYLAEMRFGEVRRSFDDVFALWSDHMQSAITSEEISAKTVMRYSVSLGQFAPKFLEGRPLPQINRALLNEIVAYRKTTGVTHRTIKRDLLALSSVLNFACGHGWIEVNPVLTFLQANKSSKLLRERKAPIVVPREQDYQTVKDWPLARQPMIAALMTAARVTGCRLSELINAKVTDLDHKRKQLRVLGKRNKERTIDLTVFDGYEVFAALPRYHTSAWLFWHDRGEPYGEDFSSKFGQRVDQVAAWAARAGVDFEPFNFHSLRNLHAIEFLKARVGTIQELQFRLGHASVQMTEAYLKCGKLTQEEVLDALYGKGRRVA
jgi:integrase/recombinase XerD